MAKTLRGEADLLHGPVLQNMLRFALPILAGTLLQQLYSMVDAVVVGQFVGKTALAAVGGSAVAIINLLLNFFVDSAPARPSSLRSIMVRTTARMSAARCIRQRCWPSGSVRS